MVSYTKLMIRNIFYKANFIFEYSTSNKISLLKFKCFNTIIKVLIMMRPDTTIPTDEIAAMTVIIEFELVICGLSNRFITYSHSHPL